jgi:adenylosuccinate lyase
MSDVLPFSTLTAVSPCDGRYADKTASLREYFSEFGLIKRRVVVEIAWLIQLSESGIIAQLPPFDAASRSRLDAIARDFSVANAERVKAIEKTTNHDMKAVEYFVKEACTSTEAGPPSAQLESAMEFVHFACTSEDVNNLSYSLMLREAREQQLMPVLDKVEAKLVEMAHAMAEVPMLAHTHGQPATPTTVGKEFANVVHRLRGQMQAVRAAPLLGTTACAKCLLASPLGQRPVDLAGGSKRPGRLLSLQCAA